MRRMKRYLLMKLSRPVLGLLLLSTAALLAAPLLAAEPGELGMKAPSLQVKAWIKGQPITWEDAGDTNIYVVEFWATWCGPCKVSIPELTKLQKKFKDRGVKFVGVSNEESETVIPFVKRMGDSMEYTVVTDLDQKTSSAYMAAFKAQGIPHSFIVGRDRRILWEGHPMMGLEQAVEQVVNGTFDLANAKSQGQLQKDFQQYFTLVCTVGSSPEADRVGQSILSNASKNASALWRFSGLILEDPRVKHRDLKLALEAAQKASLLTSNKESAILQTYARALSMNAQPDEAIKTQERAIAAATSEEDRKSLQSRLEEMRKARSEVR